MADGDQKTGLQADQDDGLAETNDNKPKNQPDRENLKQEVKFQSDRTDVKNDLNAKPKRKRRRRKKKAPGESPLSPKVQTAPFSEEVKPKEPIEEAVAPVPLAPEPVPPAPPVAPVNPFNPFETDLPPSNYEADKKVEAKDDTQFQSQDTAPQPVQDEPVKAINPFDPTPVEKPIDERAFDQKPLEQLDSVPDSISPFDVPKAPPEEIKHAQPEDEQVQNEDSDFSPFNTDQVSSHRDISAPAENVQEGEIIESEVNPVVEEVKRDLENDRELKEDFWQVLGQAGITKRKLTIFIIVFFVGIFITLSLVFGWFEGLYFWRGDGTEVQEPISEEVDEEDDEGVPGEVSKGRGGITGIISGYIFGLEYNTPLDLIDAVPVSSFARVGGYEAAFVFGKIADLKEDRFVNYINLLRKIKSVYETDIYEYVNLSVDRREAIENFISLLNDLIVQGESALVSLSSQLELLNAQYALVVEQKDLYETAFFNDANALLGQTAYDNRKLFIENAKRIVEIRAEYNSASFIFDKMTRYLAAVRPRYRDIVANKEAIIQGIKIFDLPNSDLNAIVPIE